MTNFNDIINQLKDIHNCLVTDEQFDALKWAVKSLEKQDIPINIIFDAPPSHESGRFVEVETDDGKGIKVGEWIDRKDGYWALRITSLPKNKRREQ